MSELQTTTDCVSRAKDILAQAKQVTTKEDHIEVWDNKVELLRQVNESLASGAFSGEALDELRNAKDILYQAETKAGEQAEKTYQSD